jgi:hypothetical protein
MAEADPSYDRMGHNLYWRLYQHSTDLSIGIKILSKSQYFLKLIF